MHVLRAIIIAEKNRFQIGNEIYELIKGISRHSHPVAEGMYSHHGKGAHNDKRRHGKREDIYRCRLFTECFLHLSSLEKSDIPAKAFGGLL